MVSHFLKTEYNFLMSRHDTVLMALRDLILKGEFLPGHKLAEQQLAERLGVSRTPVRSALMSLEQEGLIEANDLGKYAVREFTVQEIMDAILVRGHLEGMAAKNVAEHGVSRKLASDLEACLLAGDRLFKNKTLSLEDYAAYAQMNDRFHALILQACGNRALQRALDLNDKLPFAQASAMLPMQGVVDMDRDWMLYAHKQHHMLFDALVRSDATRAQNLAIEHIEVALMNLRKALEMRDQVSGVAPAIRLVVG